MKNYVLTGAVLGGLLFMSGGVNFAGGDKKAEPKCPVKGKAIKKTVFLEHNGGKVYFC